MDEQLQQIVKVLDEALKQKKLSKELVGSIGASIVEALSPALENIATNTNLLRQDLVDTISQIKIQVPAINVPHAMVDVKIPEIKLPDFPEIKIPEIKIPKIVVPKPEVTVNVPAFPKIPDLQWPKEKMPIEGWVQLMGVSLQNPLPVQLRDATGKPIDFGGISQTIGGGSGGGQNPTPTLKKIEEHQKATLQDFFIADKDDDATPNYFGFLNRNGEWYILKETVSAGADTYRYTKGASGYTTAWTNRATEPYDYFNTTF